MDTLANDIGSIIFNLFDAVGANSVLPSLYHNDRMMLGYHAIALVLFIIASCAGILQKEKSKTFYELFPRSGGDVLKMCELLDVTMSHYERKTRKRT